MRLRAEIPLVGLLLVVAAFSPALAGKISLEEARDRAEKGNPEVEGARARVDQARGRLVTARALLPNPELEIGIQTDRFFAAEGEGSFEISLRQPLEIFGQRGLRLGVADAEVAALTMEVDAARFGVRAQVAAAYYDLLYQELRAVTIAAVLEQAERLATAAQRRQAAGDIGDAELTLILADRAAARVEAEDAAGERAAASARLNVLIGSDPDADTTTAGDYPVFTAAASTADLVGRARARRPDLGAAERAIVARGREVALARRERWPVPVLSVGWLRERTNLPADNFMPGVVINEDDVDHIIGMRLSFALPIFQSGAGAIAEARGRHAEAEARRDGVARAITADVATARARYQSARRKLAELVEIEPKLAETLALYEKAYVAGQIDLNEFLTTRDRVLRAQALALTARRDAAAAAVELEIAAGGDYREGAK